MREWLSNDFNPPAGLAQKIAKTAVKRAKKRRAIQKTALFFIPFLIIGSFAVLNNFHLISLNNEPAIASSSSERQAKQPVIASLASEQQQAKQSSLLKEGDSFPCKTHEGAVGMTAYSPVIARSSSEQLQAKQSVVARSSSEQLQAKQPTSIKFFKIDHSLEISWDGDGEFVVYKCDSPKFDNCSVADIVSGNKYLDKDDNSAKIIYYRVEPLKKG